MSTIEAIMEKLGWKDKERDEKERELFRQLEETSGAIRKKANIIVSSTNHANKQIEIEKEGFRKLIELTEESLRGKPK